MGLYPFNPLAGQQMQGDPGATAVDMSFVAHYQFTPSTIDADGVHGAIVLPATDTLAVTTEITDPDVPRALSVVGNAAGITGNVVISGKNAAGKAISDTLVLNGTTTVEGAKAFKTVDSITVPARNAESNSITVGWTKKFGLPHKVYNPACLLVKLFNEAADTGSLAVDNDELEKNIFSLNGAPNGAKVVDLFYVV